MEPEVESGVVNGGKKIPSRKPRFSSGEGVFPHRLLPWLFLIPQLAVVGIFFLWPTAVAFKGAFTASNAFGLDSRFVGFENFVEGVWTASYKQSAEVTVVYALLITAASMGLGLFLAAQVNGVLRGKSVYRTLLIWSYAVPGAIAGTLWLFMFEPDFGPGARLLGALGIHWNFALNGVEAMALLVAITVWQQSAFNFLFYTAGLQMVPGAVLEAAAMDGASNIRRFWSVTFPLLSPMTFYLLVMNMVYAFFASFSLIDIVTQGGPDGSTETLVYRLYQDAFQNSNTSVAGAETIMLLVIGCGLTAIQFRALKRRVHFQ